MSVIATPFFLHSFIRCCNCCFLVVFCSSTVVYSKVCLRTLYLNSFCWSSIVERKLFPSTHIDFSITVPCVSFLFFVRFSAGCVVTFCLHLDASLSAHFSMFYLVQIKLVNPLSFDKHLKYVTKFQWLHYFISIPVLFLHLNRTQRISTRTKCIANEMHALVRLKSRMKETKCQPQQKVLRK